MDDISVLILAGGFLLVACILLWALGSLKKAVGAIDTHVKTVTDPALTSLRSSLDMMSLDVKAVSPSVQTLGEVAKGLQESVTTVSSQVGTIGVKAAEIAAFRDQYSEGEKLVKDMYSMFSGSYSKGKTGEEILRHWMGEFIKVGWVKGDQSIGGGHVEYAICFEDDKIIAVDSKVANTKELAALSDQDLSHETRAELRKNVVGGIRKKLVDVEKYIDPDRTLPFAVMALPDPALDVVAELIPEAANKNILILGYSAVPQLVSYFRKIYGFYKATEKIEDVRQTLSKVQHEVDRLNANFFQHNFERPIGTLEKAFDTVKDVASGLRNVLGFHAEALKETGNP